MFHLYIWTEILNLWRFYTLFICLSAFISLSWGYFEYTCSKNNLNYLHLEFKVSRIKIIHPAMTPWLIIMIIKIKVLSNNFSINCDKCKRWKKCAFYCVHSTECIGNFAHSTKYFQLKVSIVCVCVCETSSTIKAWQINR